MGSRWPCRSTSKSASGYIEIVSEGNNHKGHKVPRGKLNRYPSWYFVSFVAIGATLLVPRARHLRSDCPGIARPGGEIFPPNPSQRISSEASAGARLLKKASAALDQVTG